MRENSDNVLVPGLSNFFALYMNFRPPRWSAIATQNPKVNATDLPSFPSLFSLHEQDLRILFTSFFNSDKESYLRIRGRYAL